MPDQHVPRDSAAEQLVAEALAAKEREIEKLECMVEKLSCWVCALLEDNEKTIKNLLDMNGQAFEEQKRIAAGYNNHRLGMCGGCPGGV